MPPRPPHRKGILSDTTHVARTENMRAIGDDVVMVPRRPRFGRSKGVALRNHLEPGEMQGAAVTRARCLFLATLSRSSPAGAGRPLVRSIAGI